MKRFVKTAACLCLYFVLQGVTFAGDIGLDYSEWRWKRKIPEQKEAGFIRLSIPPEVFDQSLASLNDLRVIDSGGEKTPHAIHWGRTRTVRRVERIAARLLNQTFIPEQYARVVVDFNTSIEKNRIQVDMSGANYRRRALLEGGNDGATWDIVAEDLLLFDVSLPTHRFKKDELTFPGNNFRFLRLTVFNMPDDPRRIDILSVTGAFYAVESEKELVEAPVKAIKRSRDAKKRQSIFELDLGFRNLPTASLLFTIDAPYFYRGYELSGRNQEIEKVKRKTESGWKTVEREAPWRFVRKGVLYRVRTKRSIEESIRLETLNAPYRFLKLIIFNGDNPPLDINSATVFRRDVSLVFEAKADRTYQLIGGNPKAKPADYDLSRAVSGVGEFRLKVVHPGPEEWILPPTEERKPWTERHSTLLLSVLVVLVGAILVVILKNLRSLPTKE